MYYRQSKDTKHLLMPFDCRPPKKGGATKVQKCSECQYLTKGKIESQSFLLRRLQYLRSLPLERATSQFKYLNSLLKSLMKSANAKMKMGIKTILPSVIAIMASVLSLFICYGNVLLMGLKAIKQRLLCLWLLGCLKC